jgi:hypothetical protein
VEAATDFIIDAITGLPVTLEESVSLPARDEPWRCPFLHPHCGGLRSVVGDNRQDVAIPLSRFAGVA